MFTGIIQEVGKVTEVSSLGDGIMLSVEAKECCASLRISDSVSVNGVCQTVIGKTGAQFVVTAVEETLLKTTLGRLKPQTPVNLELPLQLGDRLGGHMVSGHVDCVGRVSAIHAKDASRLFEVAIPDQFQRYVIPVGSIAIDGVSLTVASVRQNIITVSIIPYTLEKTIFSGYSPGSEVNVEFDMIGKYVERLISIRGGQGESPSISAEQLKTWGYDI